MGADPRDRPPKPQGPTHEEQDDRMLAEWDRRFVTWRGHTLVRNDGLVWFLGELPVGVVLAAGLALAGRGVLVRQPAAASPAATAVGALVPLLGSSAARRRGRRAPLRALHLWGGCLGALVVLRVTMPFVDSGLRDVL